MKCIKGGNNMTILTNIIDKLIVAKTINEKKGTVTEQDVGIIDVDYSLIRFLGNELALKEIILNNWGYPEIRQDNTVISLYRLILKFYSQYNEELQQLLENKQLEINHINKDKIDCRLINLEIVDHKNNMRHQKGLKYETIMTSQELQEIQKKSLNNYKQQANDKEYLRRISKSLKDSIIDNKILKCCYLKLAYNKCNISISSLNSIAGNGLDKLSIPKILPSFHEYFIKSLLLHKKQFIYRTIIDGNIALFNKYIDKYPTIKEVLIKYKIMDKSNPDNPNSNILPTFYEYAYNSNKYTVNNGNILIVVSIKNNFKVVGKYKAFIMLYLLGILQRQKYITRIKKSNHHIPSLIWIPRLKDEDFQQINNNAKEILNLQWESVRYFMVAEEFGKETADMIYSHNMNCKRNYIHGLRAKEDIINYLTKNKAVFLEGVITKQRIFDYVKSLNARRKQLKLKNSKIKNGFMYFISSLFNYNPEIKETLEQQNLIYIRLNKKIINNIKKYQEQNEIKDTTYKLKPNMRVIVLKNLIN